MRHVTAAWQTWRRLPKQLHNSAACANFTHNSSQLPSLGLFLKVSFRMRDPRSTKEPQGSTLPTSSQGRGSALPQYLASDSREPSHKEFQRVQQSGTESLRSGLGGHLSSPSLQTGRLSICHMQKRSGGRESFRPFRYAVQDGTSQSLGAALGTLGLQCNIKCKACTEPSREHQRQQAVSF